MSNNSKEKKQVTLSFEQASVLFGEAKEAVGITSFQLRDTWPKDKIVAMNHYIDEQILKIETGERRLDI